MYSKPDNNSVQSPEKKFTFFSLILLIFTSVFGFNNIPISFFLMGYAGIPWYILVAVLFFIPYSFIMAEYGAAFKNERGGIYSWLSRSVGPKYAFITTFMWAASYMVAMVNFSYNFWVVLSISIFGRDRTAELSLFGLNATHSMCILSVILITSFTFIATRGLKKIIRFASLGGISIMILNFIFLAGAIAVFSQRGFSLTDHITSIKSSFFTSPSGNYQSIFSVISFAVFAITAYGGMELVGGVVDQTENGEKTFPKAVTLSAIFVSLGYIFGIFFVGMFTSWREISLEKGITIANAPYTIMRNLGYELGIVFGAGEELSHAMGKGMSIYMGLSMVIALVGIFFTICYVPIKQLIEGTPAEIWPRNMGKIEDGIPKNAMWAQLGIVLFFVIGVSFHARDVSSFFMKLMLMIKVSIVFTYAMIAGAFPWFKRVEGLDRPFVIFKSTLAVNLGTFFVVFIAMFSNIVTIMIPISRGNYREAFWLILGPILFSTVALLLYKNSLKVK